jgi:hypothetical protein
MERALPHRDASHAELVPDVKGLLTNKKRLL